MIISVGMRSSLLTQAAERRRGSSGADPAELGRPLAPVVDAVDLVEQRLERGDAGGVDRGLVHEARVEIADPRAGRARRFLEDGAGAAARQIVEHGEHAVIAAVGGDFGGPVPIAVGVAVEAVARRDAAVHAGEHRSRTCHIADGRRGGGVAGVAPGSAP